MKSCIAVAIGPMLSSSLIYQNSSRRLENGTSRLQFQLYPPEGCRLDETKRKREREREKKER
jgi:hypothetical protein